MNESIIKIIEKIKSIFGESIFHEKNRKQLISAVKDFAEDYEDGESCLLNAWQVKIMLTSIHGIFAKPFGSDILLTSSCGEHLFLPASEYEKFRQNPETCSAETKSLLKSRFFCFESESEKDFSDIYKVKYRTKHSYLENDTLLLMVVPTISCNCSCVYCQASSRKNSSAENDMSLKTALAFCDFVFALPHKSIKIEFQGGEPSLHFDTVEFIVRRISHLNKKFKKEISFVICTNLLNLSPHELKILRKFGIQISTSLDGPENLHNQNRPSNLFPSTYASTIQNVNLARANGIFPSALMTITSKNLFYMNEIIDAYIENNFESVFIRQLNNYGCAFGNKNIYYDLNDFVSCYKNAVEYIIHKNLDEKIRIREDLFSIILRKILSPFNDGFVDMQNPCALGQMCMIVKQNGDIFPSDESRMISEMGNPFWKMGSVNDRNCLPSIQKKRAEILESGRLEDYPECKSCVYSPFCYADPIKRWYIKNIAGENFETYCGIRKQIFDFVFEKLKNADESEMKLFEEWANV